MYSGINTRNIYYQTGDLKLDFRVYNYTSDHFYVGLTNPFDLGLTFKSGLIYDFNNGLVGTYNGQEVLFNGSRRNTFAEYSINGIPIRRNSSHAGEFSQLGIKVYDSGTVDCDINFWGSSPTVEIENLFSSSGVSGDIRNLGPYEFEIFDLTSTNITGEWTFSTGVPAGASRPFYINGPNTLNSGSLVNLSFKTNFGTLSYSLPVDSVAKATGELEEYYFASLALISGNSKINSNQQSFIYSVSYNTSSENLNIYFDYIENQTGNTTVTKFGSPTGSYSGWLYGVSGLCSGILRQGSPETFVEYYEIEPGQGKNIIFQKPSSLEYSAYALGQYVYQYNYYTELRNGESVPRPTAQIPTGTYLTDSGGFFTNAICTGGTYSFLLEQSRITGDRYVTGDILSQSDQGKYIFTGEAYSVTGIFKQTDVLGETYSREIMEGRLYRGIAYCVLPNDYSFMVTGQTPTPGTYVITGLIDSRYNCMLFKDVPNFSGSGMYVFSGLVSGRILVKEYGYYLSGGQFGHDSDPNGYGASGINVLSHYLNRGIAGYTIENLGTFENVSNYKSDLYAGNTFSQEFIATGTKVDFNGPGFVAHLATKENGQYENQYFRYDGNNGENLFAVPTPIRVVATDFTGQLPTPITGFIRNGYFRHYIKTGLKAGMFMEEFYPYGGGVISQADKTSINSLITNQFNGQNYNTQVNKIIQQTSPISVYQRFTQPFTGYLTSGFFLRTQVVTGTYSGTYSGFSKNITDVWNVYAGDNIDGPYYKISQPPFIDGISRYRYENIPVIGESSKYIKVEYSGKSYSVTGQNDKGSISFGLNSSSGTLIIE